MTKLYCPNCGSEVKLPEKSEIGVGMTLSKENNGTYALPLETIKNENMKEEIKTMSKREERMETLKVNGIEVGKYFDVTLPGGSTVRMTLQNGVPVVADDPILNQIIEDGYVRNSKLHRRWIMAQMFRMLNYKDYRGRETGYDACLRNCYNYQYQFDMMLEEIRVISKLKGKDEETFRERTSFFNREVVVTTCEDYITKLKNHINNLPKHKCKGVPYKRLNGRYGDVFEADLQKKVYYPMEHCIWLMSRTTNYYDLHKKLQQLMRLMIKLPYDTPKCKIWIDAYKGSGAYFTLKNLVMFHSCKIVDEQNNGWNQSRKVTTYPAGIEAVNFVKSKLDDYRGEGWRYHAMLKKCIADNCFSFDERMREIYRDK